MMVTIKNIYYHACGGKELIVHEVDLTKGIKPLLWFNTGIWGVISKEKIENMLGNLKDQKHLPTLDRNTKVGKFFWDEVEIIPPKIANLLFEG